MSKISQAVEVVVVGSLPVSTLSMVERRERAAKQMKPCPKCGSMQVQLVDWRTDTLHHRCRTCKHKFTRELEPT